MGFRCQKIRDFYLLTTDVENIFISEYMPQAPADFVKVYLYGLLHARQGLELGNKDIAKQLGVDEQTVGKAWDYWKQMGTVRIIGSDVEFVNLRELMYDGGRLDGEESLGSSQQAGQASQSGQIGSAAEPESHASDMLCDESISQVFSYAENLKGQPLSAREMKVIASWSNDDGIDCDLIKKAIEYCFERNKTSIRYLEAVIREWDQAGIKTSEQADEYIEKTTTRFGDYKRIMHALGIVNRVATDGERKVIDRWLDEMGFALERVLDACQKTVGIANPNVNYVNKILESWKKDSDTYGTDVNKKTHVSQQTLNEYYEFLRQEAERKAKEKRDEVYENLPRLVEIDDSLLDLGSRLSQAVLSGKTAQQIGEIQQLATLLEQERAVLLTENNYPIDYTDKHYKCELCQDSGIDESGRRCVCAKQRIGEAEVWLNQKRKK